MHSIANIILITVVKALPVQKAMPPADSDFWVPILFFAAFILLVYMALSTHKLKRNKMGNRTFQSGNLIKKR
jgi:hypothetical protein